MKDYKDFYKLLSFMVSTIITVAVMMIVMIVNIFAVFGMETFAQTCDYTGQVLLRMFSESAFPILMVYIVYHYIVGITILFNDDLEIALKKFEVFIRGGNKALYNYKSDEL
jgi:hypothetical protein